MSSIYMSRAPQLFLLLPATSRSSSLSDHSSCSFPLLHSFTTTMNKFKKSQVLVLFLLAFLLLIIPFLPSSLTPTFMYFIFYFVIICLGAETGLLSAFSRPLEDKKLSTSVTWKSVHVIPREAIPEEIFVPEHNEKKLMVVEKSVAGKTVSATKVEKVKKCSSTPSLFFLGGGETEAEEDMEEELEAEDEIIGGINGKELAAQAEAFIGNFYKQLKMQRQESGKKIHKFYQKAF